MKAVPAQQATSEAFDKQPVAVVAERVPAQGSAPGDSLLKDDVVIHDGFAVAAVCWDLNGQWGAVAHDAQHGEGRCETGEGSTAWTQTGYRCARTARRRLPRRGTGCSQRTGPGGGGRGDAARRPTRRARAEKQPQSCVLQRNENDQKSAVLHSPGPERFLQIGSRLSLVEAIRSRQTTLVHSTPRSRLFHWVGRVNETYSKT